MSGGAVTTFGVTGVTNVRSDSSATAQPIARFDQQATPERRRTIPRRARRRTRRAARGWRGGRRAGLAPRARDRLRPIGRVLAAGQMRTERISRDLLGPTGEVLAELVDDTVEAHEDVQDCSASTRTRWARQRRRVAWHWPAHRVEVTTPALDAGLRVMAVHQPQQRPRRLRAVAVGEWLRGSPGGCGRALPRDRRRAGALGRVHPGGVIPSLLWSAARRLGCPDVNGTSVSKGASWCCT